MLKFLTQKEKGEEMGKLQQKLAERLSDARTHNSREMTDLKVQLKDARSKVNEATNQKQEIEMKGENLRWTKNCGVII